MSVSIHTCPECSGLLLGDTASCPHCGHVIDAERAESVPPISAKSLGTDPQSRVCPLCGEKVRAGLVRCWQCGTFMNTEIENYYQKMQSAPSAVIYSISPDEMVKQKSANGSVQEPSDDDFELKYDLLREADEVEAEEMLRPENGTDLAIPAFTEERTGDDSFTLAATSMMFMPTLEEEEPTISENEYQLTQSGMLQLSLPDVSAAAGAESAGALPAPVATIPVPDGWDAEQYYQYLREAMTWYEQLEDSQKEEYAQSVTAQTGLSFPPENAHLLNGSPEPEAATPESSGESSGESSEEMKAVEPASDEKKEGGEKKETDSAPGEEHHSIATGGDVLLAAALYEQADALRRPRGARIIDPAKLAAGSFIVYCPQGHRIQVKDKHRGQTGRCPNCKSIFHVPVAEAKPDPSEAEVAAAAAMEPHKPGYEEWIRDLRLHIVQMTKLKLKAGSLQQEYETVDFGFGPDGLLVATVFKGSGSFRAAQEKKKKPENRDQLKKHLASGAPLTESGLPRVSLIAIKDLAALKVVQPANPDEESVFADVPVFGVGMIAIRLPAAAEGGAKQYVSLTLSEFRDLVRLLGEVYEVPPIGTDLGIPMQDATASMKCGITGTEITYLNGPLDFYKADPKLKPVAVGWKCAGCGVVYGEEGRKKEKLGGKDGSGMPKAKCPKCKKKIGDQIFYNIPPKA